MIQLAAMGSLSSASHGSQLSMLTQGGIAHADECRGGTADNAGLLAAYCGDVTVERARGHV